VLEVNIDLHHASQKVGLHRIGQAGKLALGGTAGGFVATKRGAANALSEPRPA